MEEQSDIFCGLIYSRYTGEKFWKLVLWNKEKRVVQDDRGKPHLLCGCMGVNSCFEIRFTHNEAKALRFTHYETIASCIFCGASEELFDG